MTYLQIFESRCRCLFFPLLFPSNIVLMTSEYTFLYGICANRFYLTSTVTFPSCPSKCQRFFFFHFISIKIYFEREKVKQLFLKNLHTYNMITVTSLLRNSKIRTHCRNEENSCPFSFALERY